MQWKIPINATLYVGHLKNFNLFLFFFFKCNLKPGKRWKSLEHNFYILIFCSVLQISQYCLNAIFIFITAKITHRTFPLKNLFSWNIFFTFFVISRKISSKKLWTYIFYYSFKFTKFKRLHLTQKKTKKYKINAKKHYTQLETRS